MFSEKLNFLMEIADVRNSSLAAAVSMDASHISRLRGGSRKLPKNQTYVMPMACYFARHINDPFKRKIVSDALHFPCEWSNNTDTAAELIYRWLTDNDEAEDAKVDKFLMRFANAGNSEAPLTGLAGQMNIADQSEYCYYGSEGKQTAVIRFLTDVLREETPQTLLLFSDEELSWLYGDPAFSHEWARLLTGVLSKGNRLKIIHTVSRDSNEMMEAVTKWIPVYMTGAIESYYYPKLRDGLFQRTLFIAPKTAAVVSNSVRQDISEMLNFYITVPDGIKALAAEYERYLSLCRPLINVMNVTSAELFFKELRDFNAVSAAGIIFAPVPSLMTMPENLVNIFAEKSPSMKKAWLTVSEHIDTLTEQNELFEIIMPPAQEQIEADAIPMPMNDFYRTENLYYTVSQYKEHLENAVKLMKKNPHYHAAAAAELQQNVMIYVKEDTGVIMAKPYSPTVVFTMREPNITAAFWSFMQRKVSAAITEKGMTADKKLESLIEMLSK